MFGLDYQNSIIFLHGGFISTCFSFFYHFKPTGKIKSIRNETCCSFIHKNLLYFSFYVKTQMKCTSGQIRESYLCVGCLRTLHSAPVFPSTRSLAHMERFHKSHTHYISFEIKLHKIRSKKTRQMRDVG